MPRGLAVLLVDLQNAYFQVEALAERRTELVQRVNALITWAKVHGCPVFNVRTEHRRDRSTWTLNMLEDDQGFVFEGEEDAAPLADLDLTGAMEVVKTRDDAFLGTELGELLRAHRVGTIVVAGVATHSCILATVTHAYAENFEVVLVPDAIASNRPELHEDTLQQLHDEYRLPLRSTDDLLTAGPATARERHEAPAT